MPERTMQSERRNIWRREAIFLATLFPLLAAVHYFSYWLRFEGVLTPEYLRNFQITVVYAVGVKLAVFHWLRVCRPWPRYATFHDLTVLMKAASIAAVLMMFGLYLVYPGLTVPRRIFLSDWGGTIGLIGGLQMLTRLSRERLQMKFFGGDRRRALIVGVNDSGESLLREIYRNRNLQYDVVGFIAESAAPAQGHISGMPILGVLDDASRVARAHKVQEILVTAGNLPGTRIRRLVNELCDSGIHVRVLPSYEQLLAGKVAMRPRDVSIEDLLRRDPVALDTNHLHRWLDGQTIFVTGSAGSIGSEICRQLLPFRPERLVLIDRSENGQFFLDRELRAAAGHQNIEVCIGDITDPIRMETLFKRYRPDIIFHAAAFKHVPLMEAHPGEAVKNITCASRALADLADRYQVRSFVMISTDKAVNPTSVMGVCKRVAEMYVQSLAQKSKCRFVTVRFGNVLGSAGSVVPIFQQQIAQGGPVCVTHPDMVRYFMTIPEASQLVIQAGAMGRGGEIFVLDMGQPVRIVDLAEDMIRLSGLRPGIDIEVRYTGIRPGEKLYEELHGRLEEQTATSHEKIMIARSQQRPLLSIRADVEQLASLAEEPREAIVHKLHAIVPTYQPPELCEEEAARHKAA